MASTTKTLAVIIPNKNSVECMKKLSETLHEQTTQPDEIVFVDDVSTDGAPDLFETYVKDMGNVKVVRSTEWLSNGGARNLGVRETKSDYVMFLDSDDFLYDKDAIKHVKDGIQGGLELYKIGTTQYIDNVVKPYQPPPWNKAESMDKRQAITIGHACWLNIYRRDLIEGCPFPERQLLEDDVFHIAIHDKLKGRVGVIPHCVYVWNGSRQNQITTTMRFFGSHPINLLEVCKADFDKQGLQDRFVSDVLRHMASMWDVRRSLTSPEGQTAWYMAWKNIIMNFNSGILVH